jgi:quercetin dioxygenase-like cupin family protein
LNQDPIFFHDDDMPMREFLKGAHVRFIHSDHMTFSEWRFEPDTDLPEHTHPHEQITKVISGIFELTVDSEIIRLHDGSAVIVPPNAVHSGKAITQCHMVDAFYPVREDYR